MEHKGLIKALKFLVDSSMQVETPVTDQHKQIAKYRGSMNHLLTIDMMCGTFKKVFTVIII